MLQGTSQADLMQEENRVAQWSAGTMSSRDTLTCGAHVRSFLRIMMLTLWVEEVGLELLLSPKEDLRSINSEYDPRS